MRKEASIGGVIGEVGEKAQQDAERHVSREAEAK